MAAAASPMEGIANAVKDIGKSKGKSSGLDWDRVAYYNAGTQEVDNMIFMANYGGQGSGVFDT